MATTRDRISDRSRTMKPYVERALKDDEVRDNLRDALAAAREIYDDLVGNRGVTTVATRVATDKDVQDNLRRAIDDLRTAAERVQGKESHKARNTLLLAGIVAGLLFNPLTGEATREWLRGLFGGGEDYGSDFSETSEVSTNSP